MEIIIKYVSDGVVVESSSKDSSLYSIVSVADGSRLQVKIKTKGPLELESAMIVRPYEYKEDDVLFLNGYQSWTETKEFENGEALKNVKKLPKILNDTFHFPAYGDSEFLRYGRKPLHSFTYSYVKHADGDADLWGSYNEENAYLIIHHDPEHSRYILHSDVKGKVVDGEFVLFDLVHLRGNVKEVNDAYFEFFGTEDIKKLRGFTSWYNDYQDINEEKMEQALSGIEKDNYDLFQIDDGYETFVGDWMDIDPVKFPQGLKGIVDEIHAKGLLAGIWLAPFVCELKSRMYKEHPDWILRKNGKEVFAGCNWSKEVALDVRKSEVWDYIEESLRFFMDLGFDFFKLDFLYAAALSGGCEEFTRAEIMRSSMKRLRSILKDKLILGCGVPLSSAFNLVDYCRIGPDITLDLDDKPYMRLMHPERPSTKITLLNTIFRHPMDGHVFGCDPDVYLLRDSNISLNDAQKEAVTVIAHLFGSLHLTSDNVKEYDDKKLEVLNRARRLSGAEIIDIRRLKNRIRIDFMLEGRRCAIIYNIEKGIIENG